MEELVNPYYLELITPLGKFRSIDHTQETKQYLLKQKLFAKNALNGKFKSIDFNLKDGSKLLVNREVLMQSIFKFKIIKK